jgi:methylenetetrahydrofolate reductase (NADPH)
MNTLGYQPDIKLTELLGRPGRFTLSAEVIPPRNGGEQAKVLNQIQTLVQSGAEFLSVTKGAGGSLRGGSLPIAQTIKERLSVPCIAHFTCRDLSRADVENSLMDHHYFGIRNILALRGDPPDGQGPWVAPENGYSYAYQLIEQIRALNEGRYLERAGFKGEQSPREPTQFCIGAAAYPEHPDPKERIEFFRLKVQAGAQFAITDMCFDVAAFETFQEACARAGCAVPLLPGARFLRTQEQAQRVMKKFRVCVPASLLEELPKQSDLERDPKGCEERSLSWMLQLIESFRRAGAPGLHLFVINDTEGASRLLRECKA